MITGLDHVNIYTAKPDETRAFFVDVLGLKVGPRPQFARIDGCWLYAGDQAVVHVVYTDQPLPAGGALDHFSLAVNDFDAMMARLEAAGRQYHAMDIPNGAGRQAFTLDPNGVKVELTWRTSAPLPDAQDAGGASVRAKAAQPA